MAHHTRFVQGRLSIENKKIPILQMTIHLLVHGSLGNERPGDTPTNTLGNRKKCVSEGLPLIPAEVILQKNRRHLDRPE